MASHLFCEPVGFCFPPSAATTPSLFAHISPPALKEHTVQKHLHQAEQAT